MRTLRSTTGPDIMNSSSAIFQLSSIPAQLGGCSKVYHTSLSFCAKTADIVASTLLLLPCLASFFSNQVKIVDRRRELLILVSV
jgi:hypothetical protein